MSSTLPHEMQAEQYRGELLAFCYRFLGSFPEAEDAVQETMLRAWRHGADFEGRSALRTWLYSIATNICLDMTRSAQRRSLPMDLISPGQTPENPASLATRPEQTWIGPIADAHLATDPAETAVIRDSVRLAFIAALQLLPPRQRAVLILRDVLTWSARECAELLDTTVASVNSALARARKTIADHEWSNSKPHDHNEQLVMNYVAAFEAYDVDRLVALLTEDAVFSMPPFELWLHGATEIERWWRGPGQICRNSRTIPTRANGQPTVAVYHDAGEGRWEPFAIHVLDIAADNIAGITHFMGGEHFAQFGLPEKLAEEKPV